MNSKGQDLPAKIIRTSILMFAHMIIKYYYNQDVKGKQTGHDQIVVAQADLSIHCLHRYCPSWNLYSPVNTVKVMSSWSVNLLVHSRAALVL